MLIKSSWDLNDPKRTIAVQTRLMRPFNSDTEVRDELGAFPLCVMLSVVAPLTVGVLGGILALEDGGVS